MSHLSIYSNSVSLALCLSLSPSSSVLYILYVCIFVHSFGDTLLNSLNIVYIKWHKWKTHAKLCFTRFWSHFSYRFQQLHTLFLILILGKYGHSRTSNPLNQTRFVILRNSQNSQKSIVAETLKNVCISSGSQSMRITEQPFDFQHINASLSIPARLNGHNNFNAQTSSQWPFQFSLNYLDFNLVCSVVLLAFPFRFMFILLWASNTCGAFYARWCIKTIRLQYSQN